MSIIEILNELEKLNGTNEKISLITRYKKELREVFRYTYDYELTYHIKIKEYVTDTGDENKYPNEDFSSLYTILNKANEGKINKAGILEYISTLHGDIRKWSIRIINRDLKIGIGLKIILKIYPEMIRTVKVQLATPLKDLVDFEMHGEEYYEEPKYDGIRNVVIISETGIEVQTRNGRLQNNVQNYLTDNCEFTQRGYVLDCEAFDKDWNTTVTSLSKSDLGSITLYAFDIFTIEEFKNGYSATPLSKRKIMLKEYLSKMKCEIFKLTPYKSVTNLDEALIYYKELINAGYEGAMLKLASSIYEGKRTKTWIKIKEKDEFTVKVLGILPGSGRFTNTMGSLQVRGKDKQGNVIEFKVGGGFSDEQRHHFWKHPELIINKCIDVSTFPSASKTAKVSFPVFVRIRTDIDC